MIIEFTNGDRINVLSQERQFDTIDIPANTPYYYTYTNLIINYADNNGNWILPTKSWTDLDGNIWDFINNGTQLNIRIKKAGEQNYFINQSFSGLYDANRPRFVWVGVSWIDEPTNNHEIEIHVSIPTNYYYNDTNIIHANYYNGYNGSFSYSVDCNSGKRNLQLVNFVHNNDKIFLNGFRINPNDFESAESRLINFVLDTGLAKFWISGNNFVQDVDPYANGGESTTGGGTGDFDGTSDSIDFPALPTLGATDTGFISLFNPTLAQLNSLATYMWSSSFDVSLYKKLVTDPLDCILGLSIVPVAIPDGGSGAITVGNMVTPIWLTKAGAQYVEVDCGSINVNEFWGAYLDFEPFTKAEIYLPYCGTHPLSVDDIMGKTVAVKYHVDILSGACCAYVKCGGNVLYSFIGQCASSIPITGGDWTNMINGVLSAAVSIGTMVATGGMSAPLAVAGVASTAVNGFKPSIEKSGAMSGTGGMLAIQKPYLILTRPKQALPENQNGFIGYPSFVTSSLGDLSGYTEIESIHLQGVPATGEELAEIEQLLKMGVIL